MTGSDFSSEPSRRLPKLVTAAESLEATSVFETAIVDPGTRDLWNGIGG